MKYSFLNDYAEGAHPSILKSLQETNMTQEPGYGDDSISKKAVQLIGRKIDNPSATIHFVTNGTQANLVVLAPLLKPYESVIAASTGHINIHESGAIEATGHKINAIPSKDGKITPEQIIEVIEQHADEHMVKPKAVFVSQSTELGTIYTNKELTAISKLCKKHSLYLYLDGARLGTALASNPNNLTLSDIARLVDVFYIGGTKNGALLGEAIVIVNSELQVDFRHYLKQHGALLAKGRVIATQFLELMQNDLYLELATHANSVARKLAEGIKSQGYSFLTDSQTNQIFPILPDSLINSLKKSYDFYVWSKVSNKESCVRLVTSWATQEKAVESFLTDLHALKS